MTSQLIDNWQPEDTDYCNRLLCVCRRRKRFNHRHKASYKHFFHESRVKQMGCEHQKQSPCRKLYLQATRKPYFDGVGNLLYDPMPSSNVSRRRRVSHSLNNLLVFLFSVLNMWTVCATYGGIAAKTEFLGTTRGK